MKAAIFERSGLDNLKIVDLPIPTINYNEVLVKIKKVGVNPIDYFTVTGFYGLNTVNRIYAYPMPHIAGTEISGIVEKVGNSVSGINTNDHVVVYNRLFDSTCDQCNNGNEMLCRNGSLIGVSTNGGFVEYMSVNSQNVFQIPKNMDLNLAASLPVCGLTAYHAINISSLSSNETLLVFGASGSTGMFVTQFGTLRGANVIAVTKKKWISEFGANHIISSFDDIFAKTFELTNGNLADVVVNSLGKETWNTGIRSLNYNGRLITFGTLTGNYVDFDIQTIYLRQLKIIGTTGGNIKEFKDLINMSGNLKIKLWKEFRLDQLKEALLCLFDKKRDGRVIVNIDSVF